MTTNRAKTTFIVSKNIRKYRIAAGLTQIALGLKVGKNVEYISKIERGISLPSVEMLFLIASALDIKAFKLLEE